MKKNKILWFLTHPIQYQTPLLRELTNHLDADLTAIFFDDSTNNEYFDEDFGRVIKWDIPLLKGYKFRFLSLNKSNYKILKIYRMFIELRKLLTIENCDVVVIHGWNHYGMILAAIIANNRAISVMIRCEATDHFYNSKGIKKIIREKILSYLFKKIDIFLSIGTCNKNFYLNRSVPKNKIIQMPYCVDNDFFKSNANLINTSAIKLDLNLHEGMPILLYVGKLTKRKNADKLIDAYKKLEEPRPYLLVVGTGELESLLKAEVFKYKLNNVRFLGFKNQKELPILYSIADIFLLPAVRETWGLVVNEAMSAGCAIITTNEVGASYDLVRSGENGYSIMPNNIDELANAIQSCINNSSYIKMGKKSEEIIGRWGIPENIKAMTEAINLINYKDNTCENN